MKFKTTKSLTFLILFIYIFSLMPLSIVAANNEVIFSCDFEDEDSTELWEGAVHDEAFAYESKGGIQVNNPFGDVDSSIFGHILESNNLVRLEGGKVYTFSAYVMNPVADDYSDYEASAYIGNNGDNLYIDLSSIGADWTYVSSSFMASDDIESTLTIILNGGDIDVGFFIDNIKITTEELLPEYAILKGETEVFIPEDGYLEYRYSLVTYDKNDNPIDLLLQSPDIIAEDLPEGVEFNSAQGLLTVFSTATENSVFTISALSSLAIPLKGSSIEIITTKNLLSNPHFENEEQLWSSDKQLDYIDGIVSLYADEDGEYGKFTTMAYNQQLLLKAGQMYVFRADVKSESDYSSSSVYISNLSFAQSGYAEINITGIGGEWSRVTSAFIIEDTGLYDLTLNLYAPTERPIYIDNVYLAVEEPKPTSIAIRAPGNITIPSDITTLPCYAVVLDQMGEVMDEISPALTIAPEIDGVFLGEGEIVVSSSAHTGEYTIRADFEEIEASLTVEVSNNYIGDGGFEEKEANEWWTASDGAIFSIIDYDGDKSGHVYSPENSCLVINNSYMELLANEYYVFSASEGFGEGRITAFIADIYSGEYVPFAQFDLSGNVKIPFSVDFNTTGRLVLLIESDDEIGVIFDDFAITPAELSAAEITVSGGDYGEFLRGSYLYVNNMTDSPDADISTTRWYISPSYDGHYEPIGIPNQSYLEFTEDMVGQFIIFEVTPICAQTGLVAESLRSLPLQIAADEIETRPEIPLSSMLPVEIERTDTHQFTDITSHWAEKMIASLSASGIVSGREQGKFVPNYYVTRAEFTAMIARAFSLVSVPYSGEFDDVSASDWYSGWIEACYKRGIITGIDENRFAPNERITREQMAVIIYRAYLLVNGELPYDLDLRYYDSFMISPWAYESVKNCTNLNFLTGDDENLFRPSNHATRAEAAALIYRVLISF